MTERMKLQMQAAVMGFVMRAGRMESLHSLVPPASDRQHKMDEKTLLKQTKNTRWLKKQKYNSEKVPILKILNIVFVIYIGVD